MDGVVEDELIVLLSALALLAGIGQYAELVVPLAFERVGDEAMGLEVSRLARNNADWQRLLEICALADTLILDEDGVYDPASFNDRLLLGLKGTMSEAELHVIKARLRGGILNKAKRGEFRCPLPTGLVYDLSGDVALDPDLRVRETIDHFFETFLRVGSASQTVKTFRKEGLLFPSRLHNSETVFRPLTASTAMRVLTNPRYAGAYTYGRRQFRRTIEGKKTVRARDNDDWLACIPDAHPGYISWERHQENLKVLKANGHGYDAARTSIPREGSALLQGRAICGQCGGHFGVRYATRRGRNEAWYICERAHNYRGEPVCQSIAGPPVDQAIGMLIAEEMTPLAVELALEVRREIQARHEEADRLRCRAIERAQIEADLAQRRFMLVDPNNHDPGASHADIADQPLEPLAPNRRCAGLALIVVDDNDLLVAPTEGDGASAERILALGALGILDDLPHRRLADVEISAAFEVVTLNFDVCVHGDIRSFKSVWFVLVAIVART